jgi:hypothetical protein
LLPVLPADIEPCQRTAAMLVIYMQCGYSCGDERTFVAYYD